MPSYEEVLPAFEGYNTQVLGISVDHVPCLKAWAESLEGISYPLLSDFWPHGEVAQRYGVFREQDGRSERALFVVDKEGIVRYVDVHDIDDQPDNAEVFRILRELEPEGRIPVEAFTRARPAEPEAAPQAPAAEGNGRSVILYCRPGCIDCRLARRFLERHGVPYTEVNVRAEPEAEARVKEWTGGPLISPVFDIDGQIIIDFKRAELAKALGVEP
ncbi:MAG: redoxin domain-containing protein [Anaerolineaceae bacterium]|nr:redoxin domain-containing protein [Anaerolineaceae bacterium]